MISPVVRGGEEEVHLSGVVRKAEHSLIPTTMSGVDTSPQISAYLSSVGACVSESGVCVPLFCFPFVTNMGQSVWSLPWLFS